jgi:tetratricopeptide (TPR) repeat protein
MELGRALRARGDTVEAVAALERACALREQLSADQHSNTVASEHELARTHHSIGNILQEARRPAQALAAYQRAREVYRRLAEANPNVTVFQNDLALSHYNIGMLQSGMGRPSDAMQSCTRALEIRQKLAEADPAVIAFQENLALSHAAVGVQQRAMGNPGDAIRSLEAALGILEKVNGQHASHLYNRACVLALISNLAGPGDKGADAGDRAMETLHRAVAAGFRDVCHMARDTDLDALRSRSDFQLLMRDLAFPSDPFASRR